MKYNRTELGGGIGFSTVIDEKFKTSSLSIRFITALDTSQTADNAVGIGAVTTSCREYRTYAELNKKLSALYGASLSSSARKMGDYQLLTVHASWINKKYAFDGEDLDSEMLRIVLGCLFEPNAENGCFDGESFDITKKDLLDKIESEINNKRGYAISRAYETAFRGEPAAYSCYGTKETASAVTPASSFAAYEKLLRTAPAEVYFIASEENPEVEKLLRERFANIERCPEKYELISRSPLKSEPATVSEELPVGQCKMVMCFKTASEDKLALKLMDTILGETPVSKLFMNVREKLSLCYYCASGYKSLKGTVTIDSGVEKDNIQKAEDEILRQLDDMKKGNFSDEDIENALMSLENSLMSIGDTPNSYISWYFDMFCDGEMTTPEKRMEQFRKITRERIIAAAQSLSLDTVYLMLNKEVQE